MSGRENCLRSLGGGALAGERIVRIAYMDEAGISKIGQEPHLVVAAAITDPDRQWHDLRRHYDDLASDFFNEEIGYGFVFHAKDVWHGLPPYNRDKYPLHDRMRLMRRLAQVPRLYQVPICLGMISKDAFQANFPKLAAKQARSLSHAMAFHLAMQRIDEWMETNCPNEVAMLVAEDTQEVKDAIHMIQQAAQSDPMTSGHEHPLEFRTRCIVDAVNFAPKARSPILQVADTCAFLARRRLSACPHVNVMIAEFWPMIVMRKKATRAISLTASEDEMEAWANE